MHRRHKGRLRSSSPASSSGGAGLESSCQSGGQAAPLRSGAHQTFLPDGGRAVQPEHREGGASKPSSSLSAASDAPSSTNSCSVNPAAAQQAGTEEPAELLEHAISNLLQKNARELQLADLEEDSSSSVEGRDNRHEEATEGDAPLKFCYVVSSDEETGDEDVADHNWVPKTEDVESEGEAENQQDRIPRDGAAPQAAGILRTSMRCSPVWAFFNQCPIDRTIVVCSLCQQSIKRGKSISRLGTTCMKNHMISHHKAVWEQHMHDGGSTSIRKPLEASSLSSAPGGRHGGMTRGLRGTSSGKEGRHGSKHRLHPRALSLKRTLPSPSGTRELPLPQLPDHRKKYSPTHPHAQSLNTSLAKLLALQLLPFQLVDSAPFREFAACAVPEWQVPSRHFFSQKAIPALHQHVEDNISLSLEHAISGKVHITTDMWSSQDRQKRYISFTAHWVNLLAAKKDAIHGTPLQMVVPPRVLQLGDTSNHSSTSAGESSEPPVLAKRLRTYIAAQSKRCHVVLQLLCLEDRRHTEAEILAALQRQAQRWLTPCYLVPGKVVCDSGTTLLSALQQGNFIHVPCLAHVLNLVVQRFLLRYPGFHDLLQQVRRVCNHFRWSHPASVRLAEIQQQHNLPTKRLICDISTWWNATLPMLRRLRFHQRAINEYLCEYRARTNSGDLGLISPRQWLLIQDACSVLSPFEEATRMVCRDEAGISDTIPLVFLLEQTLRGVIDRALEQKQEQEQVEFLMSLGTLCSDSVPARQHRSLEREEEEDWSADSEEEEDMVQASSGTFHPNQTPGVVRWWGEMAEDTVTLSDIEDSGTSTTGNVLRMGSYILQCLGKDPRILAIKESDHYWLATLLDPRYKEKMPELMLSLQREQNMSHLQEVLQRNLLTAFPESGRMAFHGQRASSTQANKSRSGGGLGEAFRTFFSIHPPGQAAGTSHSQRITQMIDDYMGTRVDGDTLRTDDPLDFWVSRMDQWPELAQYAIELLGCPAASVLSEKAFSAVGGSVIDKGLCLPPDTAEQLTFIKLNQSWISNDYKTPAAEANL